MRIIIVSSAPLQAKPTPGLTGEDSLQYRVLGDLIGFPPDLARDADLLLLSGYPIDGRLVGALESCSAGAPHCAPVPVLAAPTPAQVVQLMQAGAADLVASLATADLDALIGRVRERLRRSALPVDAVRSLGLVAAKGGDGATCIAANLAAALARCPATRVMAIDLSLPFGDLEIHLSGEQAQHDLADVLAQIERLDASLLDTLAHPVGEQLRVVASPADFQRFIDVRPALVERLLTLAGESYRFVVADLGTGTDPLTLSLLGRFDQLLMVTTPDIASLRRAAKVIRMWQSMGVDMARVGLVVNRVTARPEVPVARFAATLGLPVVREIADEPEGVSESLLEGAPVLVTAPASAFSRAIRRWAADLAGTHPIEESLWTSFKQLWRAA
jgi:pilus assembly protein CpaE